MVNDICQRLLTLITATMISCGFLSAQESGIVVGNVVDHLTREPVENALVGLDGSIHASFTDAEGGFRFTEVSPGNHLLIFEHLSYGDKSHIIDVRAYETLSLEIVISPTAISLSPLLVKLSPEALSRRIRGASSSLVMRHEIEAMENRAGNIGDVLRAYVPGITVWPMSSHIGNGICVEFRRATSMRDPIGCQMPVVIVDGIRIPDPALYLESIPIGDVESLEVLPVSEGGTRYGLGTGYGTILITTRRPENIIDNRAGNLSPVYDWGSKNETHPSARAFLGAALGNTVGLLLSSKIGGKCFNWFDMSREIRELDCGGVEKAFAHIGGMALPALGAGFGTHFLGVTDLSRGRPMIAAAAATSALSLGLGVMTTTGSRRVGNWERNNNSDKLNVQEVIGGILVGFAAPAMATLADYLFRSLRD